MNHSQQTKNAPLFWALKSLLAKRPLFAWALILAIVACSDATFNGQANNKNQNKDDNPTTQDSQRLPPQDEGQGNLIPDGGQGGFVPGGNPIIADPGVHVFTPKSCDSSSIVFIRAGQNCPANYATYAIDDARFSHLACCPLPSTDILIPNNIQSSQGGQCPPNTVIVGVKSDMNFNCAAINTSKYFLQGSQATCYHGSGASGGDGATSCGAPSITLQQMASAFGSDACLGFPFGALITSQNGKNCRDMQAAQLFDRKTNQALRMFK